LREFPEGLVEDGPHEEAEGEALELVGDVELDGATGGIGPEGPAVLEVAERAVDVLDEDAQARAVEGDAGREDLVDAAVADPHLGDEGLDPLPARRPAAHGKPFAQRQELGILLHVRHEVEHFLGAMADLPRGAERRH
jgi:hypothetical protein